MENIVNNSDRIVAMTYNVCFGCMYSDFSDTDGKEEGQSKFDATSRKLVTLCSIKKTEQGKNICLFNIQTVFEFTKSQYGDLDLVGIQEASNWEALINTPSLNDLSYVNHVANKNADMVSLYNHKKFKLDAFIVGNITSKVLSDVEITVYDNKTPPTEYKYIKKRGVDGRPYQLLFLTHRVSKQKYIFINIHNSHLYTREELVFALGQEKRALIPTNNTHSFKKCDYDTNNDNVKKYDYYTIYENYTDTIKHNNYGIIFMGDTNDQGRRDLWKEDEDKDKDNHTLFTPLKELGITTEVSSKGTQPPNSCCSGRRNLRPIKVDTDGYIPTTNLDKDDSMDTDNKYGDYILISENLTYESKNVIPKFPTNAKLFPTSDHLPVVSVIILEHPDQQLQGGRRRDRRKHKSARQLHTRNRHKHKQTKLKHIKTKRIYKK